MQTILGIWAVICLVVYVMFVGRADMKLVYIPYSFVFFMGIFLGIPAMIVYLLGLL